MTIKVAVSRRDNRRHPVIGEEPMLSIDPNEWAGADRDRLWRALHDSAEKAAAHKAATDGNSTKMPERYLVPTLSLTQIAFVVLMSGLVCAVSAAVGVFVAVAIVSALVASNSRLQSTADENWREEMRDWLSRNKSSDM